jgi:DNA-directed RNA polymerase II subunit RPB1
MSFYKLNDELDDSNFKTIKKIQLGLLNPEEIKKGAVCEILNAETYEGGEPKINGLFDPRMGSVDKNSFCITCGNYNDICPGHFGKIELAVPFFNINTVDIVKKLLKCVCIRCSNLLIDKDNPIYLEKLKKMRNIDRFNYIYEISSKITKCNNNASCNRLQPIKYEKLLTDKIPTNDNALALYAITNSETLNSNDSGQKNKIKIRPMDCLNIFKRITDEDVVFLGFNHIICRPEWLLLTVLPVPPPCVRPAATYDNDLRAEDDLTHLLNNIVKNNNQLKQKIAENQDQKIIESHIGLLQYQLISFINNEISGIPPQAQRSSRNLKGLVQRLKQKEGRIRLNLMGKRVDYSARTVISVDPNIDIDQFGVPLKMAMNLTFPEKITKYNIKKMRVLLLNGPDKYPGVKRIKKKEILEDGTEQYCEYSLKIIDPNKITLEIGDILYRHLLDDDIVLFNRQPTLHRMGMMAHRIKILPHSTFRLNVTATTPYNADFDGDEMNAHVPQSYKAAVELKNIALVPTQIITPGKCKPVIGIIQDTLVGAYCFTKFNVFLNKRDVMNLFVYDEKVILPKCSKVENGVELWSGKDVFSMILPEISLDITNNSEEKIFIENGILKEGVLDSKIVGSSKGGLIHLIYNSYNQNVCKKFLDDIQKIITRWFENFSLSFSIADILPTKSMEDEMDEIKLEGYKNVENIIYKMNHGIFNPDLDTKYLISKMEIEIGKSLENVNTKCSKILKANFKDMNNFSRTITSGSKGKTLNMRQVAGLVGQQIIWGSRVDYKYTDRTLPHFSKHDYSADSKGFVANSFIKGMTPTETFFHAMGGRIGVIDTAVKTAGVGYVSRRLVKSLEDVKVTYDLTVRNAFNTIIQFAYGDDNMDPTNIEVQRLQIIALNNDQIKSDYYYDLKDEENDVFLSLDDKTLNDFKSNKENYKLVDNEFKDLVELRDFIRTNYFNNLRDMDTSFLSPINLFRLIQNIQYKFKITKSDLSNLNPVYILKKTNDLIESFMKYINEKDSMILLKVLIRSLLSTKKCIYEYRFTVDVFDHLIELVRDKILKSFVQSGESVGIIVEQSYYEELQQATLNTFHTAGTGHNISQGVERFSEIINVSKNLKSPQMYIYLKSEYTSNLEMALYARSQIDYTKMEDVVSKSLILYNNENTYIQSEEYEYVRTFNDFNEIINTEICDEELLSKWMIQFEFDKDKLMNKNLTMIKIYNIIMNNFISKKDISCIVNDDNSSNLTMLIRVKEIDEDTNYLDYLKELEKQILSITLHGIEGILYSDIKTQKKIVYEQDGSYNTIEEYYIETNGANLKEVLNHPMVDKYRTFSNEVIEILEIFGIEAAREYFVREFNNILEDKIVYRHHALLADLICLKGKLMQIARYGINKSADYSPFAKASFEEVVDVLIKASTFGEHDNMQGVSSNIMVGQHCNIGTNFFNVLLNEEEFIENFRGNLKVKTTKKEIDLKDLKTIDITNDDFDSKIDITDQYQLPKKELPKLSKTIPSTKKDSATKKDTNKNTIMSDVVEKNTEKIGKIGNTENDEDDKEGDNKEGDDEEEPVKKKETKTKTKVEKEKVVKKKPVIKKIKK